MKRILQFKSPTEQYLCDAVVVACFDNRFDPVLRKFLKCVGIVAPDPIIVAGGAKSLASPEHDSERAFLIAQVEKSIRLHGTRRVVLLLHSDCGAYGGLHKTFNGDEKAEVAHHRGELRRAYAVLMETFPALSVECYFMDFKGVWQLNTPRTPASAEPPRLNASEVEK